MTTTTTLPDVIAAVGYERHREARQRHWDEMAVRSDADPGWGGYYRERLLSVFRHLIPPGQRVLEIGCGRGDLLAGVSPSVGVGIDFSPEMVARASQRHPHLRFFCDDAHEQGCLEGQFDWVILSDLVNDLWDVQAVLQKLHRVVHPGSRLILNSYSRLWELPLAAAERMGLAHPTLHQNWLTVEDLSSLLALAGFEVIRHWPDTLLPLRVPGISSFCNRFLARLWPFSMFALTNVILARPSPRRVATQPRVSVIVPARNEAGNVAEIFTRTPEMGSGTELVFVEGHSTDDTLSAIETARAAHPGRACQVHRQTGTGKGDAVRLGFASATGDILMILDADLTVPPEDLTRFYEALCNRTGDFINGVRLMYPMEDEAMRFFNLLGNKFFSLAFSWLLGQPVKDTLCGTKVLWRSDYERIAANRAYFGDFDPFGDFDLLFGAAKLGLKCVDLPVRYRARIYGSTNIQRWRHGWLLLRMVAFAAGRLKFV